MPNNRTRLLLAALGLLVFAALLFALYGCAAPGGGEALGWLIGTGHTGPQGGGSGDSVPGVWGGLGREISTAAGQIKLWFGLGGLACFGLGIWRAIRMDWLDAAKCIGAAIALGIVGAIVSAIFTGLAWLVVSVTGAFGIVLAVQWGRGKSVFGHAWKCVGRLLRTGADRHPAAETGEVTE